MILRMSWPHKNLSPNARVHRMVVAKEKRAARNEAFWVAAADMQSNFIGARGVVVTLTFCPPDKRRRDLDNMLSSCKAMLDGLSDAIGVDDSEWSIHLKRGASVKGGAVHVEVTAGYLPSGYTDIHRQIAPGADTCTGEEKPIPHHGENDV